MRICQKCGCEVKENEEKCPRCGKILYKKQTKKINRLYCAEKECGYSVNLNDANANGEKAQ